MVALWLLRLGGRRWRRGHCTIGRRRGRGVGDGRHGLSWSGRRCRRRFVGCRIPTRDRRVRRRAQGRTVLDASAFALVAERLVVVHLIGITIALAVAAD